MEAARTTCPRCDAPRGAATRFCTRCGRDFLVGAPDGSANVGRHVLGFAHGLGSLLANIARVITRLTLAFTTAFLANLVVVLIGATAELGPGVPVIAFLIGCVVLFVVLAWSARLVLAPRFWSHCGQALVPMSPAPTPRERVRSAASGAARVSTALVVAGFVIVIIVLVVSSGQFGITFAEVWPVTLSALFLVLLPSPAGRRLFGALAGSALMVSTGIAIIYFGRLDVLFGSWFWLTVVLAALVAWPVLFIRPQLYRPLVRTRARAGASVFVALSLIAGENYALLSVDRSSMCDKESAPQRSSRPAVRDFAFVSANDQGLRAIDASGVVLGPIVDLPLKYGGPRAPALLPDRKAIVFEITIAGPESCGQGFGSDIWAVDLDGSNLRKLVEHRSPGVEYESPVVDPIGGFVYMYRSAPSTGNEGFLSEESLERLDLRTKEIVRVASIHALPPSVNSPIDLTLAPDGKTLVYTEYFGPGLLWRIGTDGSGRRPFLPNRENWAYIHAPTFAPSGSTLAFSGAGRDTPSRCGLSSCGESELYLAQSDGTAVRSVARIGDRNVTWSLDGTQLAFVADGRIRILTVADGSVRSLTPSEYLVADLLWVKDRSDLKH